LAIAISSGKAYVSSRLIYDRLPSFAPGMRN
jgi:hypothetical protein